MDRFQAMATFVRVVEAGSFSSAARRLGVGQPAISKSVAQLETQLGVRLLMRSTRGLAPTEAGQRFLEHARAALHEADEADLAARGAGRGLSGRLRLSAAPTFARLHVIPHLPAFLAAHPELTVDMVLDDRPIDLISEGIDVSLRMGELADSGVVARRLAQSRRSVLATPRYLRRAGRPAEGSRRSCRPRGVAVLAARVDVGLHARRDRDLDHGAGARQHQRCGRRPCCRARGHGPDRHVGLDVRA